MEKLYSTGEFAKIAGVTIRTIRYYDKIGLLKPYRIDQKTNYRYYHINQSQIVDEIQYLRQLDFSLEEINGILSKHENLTELNHYINE